MPFPLTLALFFDSVGAAEWLVLGVVILIVVGPKRLPEVARKLGRMTEMFRRAADEFRRQLMTMDQEPVKPPQDDPNTPTDEDGVPQQPYEEGSTDDPYANAYPDEATYPGNEDQMGEWSSEQLTEYPPADESGSDTTDRAEADAAAAAASLPPEEPTETNGPSPEQEKKA